MSYVPISFKSDYSLLKSLLKIKDIIDFAVKNNATYVGLLDDNPYGFLDFYDKCEKNNLKCVLGMILKIGEATLYLYIKNYDGYLNIIKINNLKNDNNLTFNDLIKYNDGLILVLPYNSYNLLNRFKTSFNVYLSYKNDMEKERALSFTKNIVFINEVLSFYKEDTAVLKMLYRIGDSEYKESDNYLIPASEQDIASIQSFQDEIDLKLEFKKRYIPNYLKDGENSASYLRSLAIKGLQKRLNGKIEKKYIERIEFELSVIEKMGFVDYFLIVYDYVKYAKKHDILVGPGRGSAAGALVSYSLGITEIDPLKYNLLFERFLNPARVTMPDIDIDFEDIRREEVIRYVRSRYGEKNVALILAYGTLGSRQVLRDVAKKFEIDNSVIDELAKMVDAKSSLRDNLKNVDLVNYIKNNKLEIVYKISMKLEGLKRHTTIHAAGVVISSDPLDTIIPILKTNDGILTGCTMEYLEKLGLLKMDFLALRNLTIIHNVINSIKKIQPEFSLADIPLNDDKTFEVFRRGDTDSIFQFESVGMKRFLKKLSPRCFDDLVAANALFRPGPMQNIDEYVNRKNGLKKIDYLHPNLKNILESTYGIIVYQEQIMQILVTMGGYTYSEADMIRRAMSKKKHDVMEKERTRFVELSIKNGYSNDLASKVYNLILQFADYGFNKSHSVAYALLGYQMAYLKANYPNHFQLNTLNMGMGNSTKIKDIIDDAKIRGLNIVKPDINKSKYEYEVVASDLILPLTSIKDINSNVSKYIVNNAPYSDFFDFFKKVYGNSVNRKNIEILIKAGALDSFGYSKVTLLDNIDSAITYVELCDQLDESLVLKPEITISNSEDFEVSELDVFGYYIYGHPVLKYKVNNSIKIVNDRNYINKVVYNVALIEKIKSISTKNGDKMAFLDLSDDTGKITAVIFPKNNDIIDSIEEHQVYEFIGKVDRRDEAYQLIVNKVIAIEKR